MPESLDFCGCCQGVERETPATVENRPGLSALVYRVGTHGRFMQSMQTALGEQPALADLTARAADDPTVALLDVWATVLDVLSFYQERIAIEGFLRTATERRSVLELARRIGYELRPGVAASTYLAFTMQTGPGAPESATVHAGTQAQSVPGQDETPQTFETVEPVEARAEWQALRARQRRPSTLDTDTTGLWLEGVDNNLSPGDGLLLVGSERARDPGSERWDFRLIHAVDLDRRRGLTYVTFEYKLGSNVPPVRPAEDPTVYIFRQRAALFGHNAPDWDAMPAQVRLRYDPPAAGSKVDDSSEMEWPDFTIDGVANGDDPAMTIYLDALYPKIFQESWVVLEKPGYAELYRVDEVAEAARSNFTLTAKTTRLSLKGEHLDEEFDTALRETVVFAVSEPLVRADAPIEAPVEGAVVVLTAAIEGLSEGQLVAVTGTDVDAGEVVAEVATITAVETTADGLTQLTFAQDLEYRYAREDDDDSGVVGVRFNANVAPATHGKTVAREVLGSGDGSASFQAFTLAQTPLTYVSAATASGVESSLEVRVDGVRWDEVPSLYGQPPDARVYITRLADDGTVTVQSGDGRTGARLPSGVENVRASYRYGLGLAGLVDDEQISLLMTRPLGVKGVTNPTAPTGADDPEPLADARSNAPLTVLTLDRIVSVQDFEDFAAAFAGIGKARATVLWSGERRLVHLTIAGAEGAEVAGDSTLYANLLRAIDGARHPDEDVVVASYDALTFTVEATVIVGDAYVAESVAAAVEAALLDAFSFEERTFGQGTTASEVLAVMQAVEGVVAVDLDLLGEADPFVRPHLPARIARWKGRAIQPAELLTIASDGITLTTASP